MANAMNADLKGKVIVIKRSILKDHLVTIPQRSFKVTGGFGSSSFTSGTALIGQWTYTDEKDRMEGYDIDVKETLTLWSTKT